MSRHETGQADPASARPSLTVAIRVTPASARTAVGGRRGDAVVVRVTEAAVDGRATEAALVAFARALGLRRGDVELRAGATSRDKVVTVCRTTPEVIDKLESLLADESVKRRPT